MKKVLAFAFAIMLSLSVLSVSLFALSEADAERTVRNTIKSDNTVFVIDYADILTDSEEKGLQSELEQFSNNKEFDIVVLTVTTLDDKSEAAYADDFYDYNEYGYGENRDGCLLLIHIGEDSRHIYISTCGKGIDAISDDAIYDMCISVRDYYLNDNLEYGIKVFINDVSYYLGQFASRGDFKLTYLLIGAVVGLVVALIVSKSLTAKMKTVRFKASANDYYDQDSMRLTGSYDRFVGVHVITRVKEQSRSSGGSSSHTSSSGTSHGGGGISF